MYSLLRWVVSAGNDAVQAVERLEKDGAKVTVGGLREGLDNMIVPEDHLELARQVSTGSGKQTMQKFKKVGKALVRARWWTWHLQHPDQETFVHKSRSVLPLRTALYVSPSFVFVTNTYPLCCTK